MFRRIALIAIFAGLTAAWLLPTSASAVVSDPAYGCPRVFDLVFTYANGVLDPTDHNADGWGCRKTVSNGRFVLIDNTIFGSLPAQGLTDGGSSVLVDTTTGEIVAG
jgi:hypothetical protein